MRTVTLPSGARMPVLGLGTWRMGESARARPQETAAVAAALDAGLTLIDTAEMYGEGGAEEAIAPAIRGRREGLFLVSKVYPHNATRRGTVEACERSLKRLGVERIDLYLLHWQGSAPYAETIEAFERLKRDGKIADHGVSNFDAEDLQDWIDAGGGACATNQVMYSLAKRGPEFDLLPRMRTRAMPLMAYSPLDQGSLLRHSALGVVARRLGATPAQVAVAWTLRDPLVVSIPKSSNVERVRAFVGALDLVLSPQDLAELDAAFPPPRRKAPLAMA
jgi:diketogulonate reductase-like aldo/keto reductase